MTTKAVILARGLGTRMRQADATASLDAATDAVAASGVKAMIPTLGRPFLDFVLSALADAGITEACLVLGPEHQAVRDYYGRAEGRRVRVSFATQEKPLGTADAVRPVEAFAAGEPFLMLNSDNFYPAESLATLARTPAPAVAVFAKTAMLNGSNIAADRIGKFSVVDTAADGSMTRIIEKPDAETLARFGDDAFVSMNCWLFDAKIFDACRAIGPSPRGEYEITDAVQHCIDAFGQRFTVAKFASPVLDLSNRGDIAAVNDKLRGVDVRP